MTEETAGTDQTTLTSGSRIIGGAYEVERLIKAGGMGEVYRGRNVRTGRHVAIKIILSSLARDETYMALFEREAEILEGLAHDAIVRYQLYAVDQTTGRPCLVMQFVPGPSLKERMEQGPMSAEDIRVLTRRVASGLRAAHDHKFRVFHRDLSPDNVILEDGRVELAKLIDFGIAKGGGQDAEKSMLAGKIAGKFSYMAPEQLGLFQEDVDARTDIYSLGLIILGLFRGQAVDMGKTIGEAVLRRQSIPDLSAAAPEMQYLLQRMLSPDPKDRPAKMGDVLQILDQSQPLRPRPLGDNTILTQLTPAPTILAPPDAVNPTQLPTPSQAPQAPAGLDMDATVVRDPPIAGKQPDQRPPSPPAHSPDEEKTDFFPVATPQVAGGNLDFSAPEFPLSEFPVAGLSEFSDIGKPAENIAPASPPAIGRLVKSSVRPPLPAESVKASSGKAAGKKAGLMLPLLLVAALITIGAGAGYYFIAGPAPQQTAPRPAKAPKKSKKPEQMIIVF